MGPAPFASKELLHGCQDTYYRLKQMPLDLQLSANKLINHVEEDRPNRGHAWNHPLKEPIDVKHPLSANYSSGTEELKLSLTTRDDYRRTEGTLRTWFDKRTHQYCSVIDLESEERISDDSAKCTPSVGCATPETYSPGKYKKVSAFSSLIFLTSAEKDPSVEISESSYFQEHSECCQEQTSSNEGTDNQPLEISYSILCMNLCFWILILCNNYMLCHHVFSYFYRSCKQELWSAMMITCVIIFPPK